MPILPVTVNEKIATYTGSDRYICGNSDFVVELTLDDEWEQHDAKTARFVYGREYTDVVFTGNTVSVPVIEKAHEIQFGIYAGNLRTTTPAGIPCDMSIRSYNKAPAAPSQTVYDQIMELLNQCVNSGGIKSVEIIEETISADGGVGEFPVYFLAITEKNGKVHTVQLPNIEVDPAQIVKLHNGKPTEYTEGVKNQILVDTENGTMYVCTDVALVLGEYVFTWLSVGGMGSGGGITEESDPTVPAWAKAETKPTYTAAEVGARPDTWMPTASDVGALPASTKIPESTSDLTNDSGYITIAVATLLNYYLKSETYAKTETYSQTEVDNLISGLDKRLAAIADSDDTTLDQLSEIVAYIKANKSLIDSITTDKVNVSDIIDNLTTADSKKPLSAAQGKELKTLYDSLPAWAKAEEKPSYSKSEVGLGNVDNVRQYSASNPPPYPVTSVNGQAGAVTVTAAGIGAATTERAEKIAGQAEENKREIGKISQDIADYRTQLDGKQPKGNYLTEVPDEYVTEDELEAEIDNLKAQVVQQAPLFAESLDWLNEKGDTSKVYVLPDGYIYGYIKTITEGETVPNFTNALTLEGAYIKDGYRYSNSSGTFKEQPTDCAIVIPIPVASSYTFRTRGGSYSKCSYPTSVYLGATNSEFRYSTSVNISYGVDENGDTYAEGFKLASSVTDQKYAVFHIDSGVNPDTLIVTVNEEITYTTTEGGLKYQWANTGHAFTPADYEERIIDLEKGLVEAKSDINNLEEKIDKVSISGDATTAFSIPAYAPVPQLPADGSEGSDFNSSTITTQDAYDYMDALANKYTGYITKQTMGKDASGGFDHNRYVLTKAYWRAWQKENYPKMYAWKNGSTVVYSVSVSPRVGDSMYSTAYVGTIYGTVTTVNVETGVLSTRTVGGLIFERNQSNDIEPTIVYTSVPMMPPGYFATAPVYNSSYNQITNVSSIGDGYFVGVDGITYIRYPFEDKKADKTKPLSIFILSNEHGLHGDALIPSMVVMRMAKDLCKNTDNPFLKWLKENCMITMIPVGNPWGYGRYLVNNSSGYYNSNGININRNYDTPGWETSDTNYGDTETFGAYPGSEIETQHIMNTMRMCKPDVGISMHGLEYPDEYRGLTDNGYFIYQGQGFDKARMYKVAETLFSSYGLSRGTSVDYAQHYEMCGKSPAYIQYVGAVGGLTETICWEAGTENEYTSIAMEQAYTQLLLFLQTWCEEALEKLS